VRLAGMFDYKGGHLVYNNSERIRCSGRNVCAGLIDPESSLREQAASIAVRSFATQAGYFEKGDFIRFRELSLTYTAPEDAGEPAAARPQPHRHLRRSQPRHPLDRLHGRRSGGLRHDRRLAVFVPGVRTADVLLVPSIPRILRQCDE
jgi:hypothetical protein